MNFHFELKCLNHLHCYNHKVLTAVLSGLPQIHLVIVLRIFNKNLLLNPLENIVPISLSMLDNQSV